MVKNTNEVYWVLSEIETHVSKPQQYVSETRHIKDRREADDWRDWIEGEYRKNGDNREVILVNIIKKVVYK